MGKERLRGSIKMFSNLLGYFGDIQMESANKQLDLGKCGALRKVGSALTTLKVRGCNIKKWARFPWGRTGKMKRGRTKL